MMCEWLKYEPPKGKRWAAPPGAEEMEVELEGVTEMDEV